jgi:hypothetical protein
VIQNDGVSRSPCSLVTSSRIATSCASRCCCVSRMAVKFTMQSRALISLNGPHFSQTCARASECTDGRTNVCAYASVQARKAQIFLRLSYSSRSLPAHLCRRFPTAFAVSSSRDPFRVTRGPQVLETEPGSSHWAPSES